MALILSLEAAGRRSFSISDLLASSKVVMAIENK
jgi:hypothetical protein